MRISDWSSDVCSSDRWEASPAFAVKSITAYRSTKSFFKPDDDTPLQLIELQTDQTAKQFSEELQFSGKAFDNRMTWLAGLFYLNKKVKLENRDCFAFTATGVSKRPQQQNKTQFPQTPN